MIMNKTSEAESSKTMENIKLPFIEKFSKFFESKLQRLTELFCIYVCI